MMAPARGSRRYVEVLGGGGLSGSWLGGSGTRAAGAIATMLIMFMSAGGGSVMPWAMVRSVSSASYAVKSSRIWTRERSGSTLDRVQNGRLMPCSLCGSSGGDVCMESRRAGSSSSRSSDWIWMERCCLCVLNPSARRISAKPAAFVE